MNVSFVRQTATIIRDYRVPRPMFSVAPQKSLVTAYIGSVVNYICMIEMLCFILKLLNATCVNRLAMKQHYRIIQRP